MTRRKEEFLEKCFKEICKVVKADFKKLTFNAKWFRNFSAFARKDYIQYDQQIGFWLLDFCQLITIMACKVIDDEESETITSLVCKNLNTISNPYLYENNQELIKPLLFKHSAL